MRLGRGTLPLALAFGLAVAPGFPGLGIEILATDADPAMLDRARRATGEAGHDLWSRSRGGMSPERVLELGGEIQRTLNRLHPQPNLQMLLLCYSHCGHTLLRAAPPPAAAGTTPVPAPATPLDPAARPLFDRERVGVRELRFPCDRVFAVADRLKGSSLHQGHQRWGAGAEIGPEERTEPRRSICVYAGASDQCLEGGGAALELLGLCGGRRTLAKSRRDDMICSVCRRSIIHRNLYI